MTRTKFMDHTPQNKKRKKGYNTYESSIGVLSIFILCYCIDIKEYLGEKTANGTKKYAVIDDVNVTRKCILPVDSMLALTKEQLDEFVLSNNVAATIDRLCRIKIIICFLQM